MLGRLFKTTSESLETLPESKDESASIIKLFHEAAERVPAYKDFLKKHHIKPETIKTLQDFKQVPVMTKENYLKKYPFKDLLWDGDTSSAHVISMSSGSSGEPFYWPRGQQSAEECLALHETLFNQNFKTLEKPTLVIIAFAMGTWIAGTYTLQAMTELAAKGHKIVTITPGIDKIAVIRILQQLSPQFEQTIIFGYPPFVKDIIDSAVEAKVKLHDMNVKCVFAGENISEKWREYMLDKMKARDEFFTTATIYGTADAGLLGNETPMSIYARRLAMKDDQLLHTLFPGTTILPSLVHYEPKLRYFEEIDHYLVFTVNNSLPLIRYQIMDQGRLISHAEIVKAIEDRGYKIPAAIKAIPQEAYIAIYGRTDIATIFYALNVYPENVKYGLENRALQKFVTGKFRLKTIFDDQTQEQTLHLYVELKNKVTPSQAIEKAIMRHVLKSLRTYNSEFNRLHQELQHKAEPVIELIPYESPDFAIKIKHRWT